MSDEIQKQLATLSAQLAHSQAQDDALEAERLQQRTRSYGAARPVASTHAQDAVYDVLAFRLDDERYALDVAFVQAVRRVTHIARVPGAPAFYRGVVNVGGKIITVFDLRLFLGKSTNSQPQELIIVADDDLTLAFLADHIEEVRRLPREEVEPIEMNYGRGVTMKGLVLLDLPILLSDERLILGGSST